MDTFNVGIISDDYVVTTVNLPGAIIGRGEGSRVSILLVPYKSMKKTSLEFSR